MGGNLFHCMYHLFGLLDDVEIWVAGHSGLQVEIVGWNLPRGQLLKSWYGILLVIRLFGWVAWAEGSLQELVLFAELRVPIRHPCDLLWEGSCAKFYLVVPIGIVLSLLDLLALC